MHEGMHKNYFFLELVLDNFVHTSTFKLKSECVEKLNLKIKNKYLYKNNIDVLNQ